MKIYSCDKCKSSMEKPSSITAYPIFKMVRMANKLDYELCERCYRKAVKVIEKHLGRSK